MACLHHHHAGTDPMPFAEPGVQPSYPPDRAVRIVHLSLSIALEPEVGRFGGEVRAQIEAFPTYAGRFSFDLDEVEVESVTDAALAPLPFEHIDGELWIEAESAPSEVRVRFHGENPRHGLFFTGPTDANPGRSHSAWTQCQDEDAHFVFPCHDHPSVKHPFSIELTAPLGYTLLSNGRCEGSGEREGRAWARYEQQEPMPAYLVTLVAAKLSVLSARWRDIPVRYLAPEASLRAAERAFGRTPEMIEHFSLITGVPFPWPRYDQVVVDDFIFGGMENVACTTMTDAILVDEEAVWGWDPEELVSHELAHQWFGDLVTCQDWSQAWLNESWATFMEAIWAEHAHGEIEGVWYRYETAQGYIGEHTSRYQRPIVSYLFREPIDLFDRHLYNKGSCVLWTLRALLGDRAFFAGVRRYLEDNRHKTVHTRHLQRALEEATGRNLERFFAQWLYGVGHPVLDLSLSIDRSTGALDVSVKQRQSGEGIPEVFFADLHLELVSREGVSRTVRLSLDARERTYTIPAAGELLCVRVDPGYRLLAEISISAPDTWLERLSLDADPVLALRAVRSLMTLGTSRSLAAVREALVRHPFYGLRGAVASALGASGSDAALAALAAALRADPDLRSRREIAAALGAFRKVEAADALIALLDEPIKSWHLRGAALLALGQTRDGRAKDLLIAELSRESWGDHLRQQALKGLAETQDPSVLPILLEKTGSSSSDRCRAAAASALATLADERRELRGPAVERLVQLARASPFPVQMASIAALGALQDPDALPALALVHRTAPDGRTRRAAFEATAKISRGRTADEGLSALRRRVDALSEENAKPKQRVERLER